LARPNQLVSNKRYLPGCKEKNPLELFDVPDSDAPTSETSLTEGRKKNTLVKCMAKWGPIQSMFRDIKTNKMQHTEVQLRKMGARFLLLSPDQRRVEVPAKVLCQHPTITTTSREAGLFDSLKCIDMEPVYRNYKVRWTDEQEKLSWIKDGCAESGFGEISNISEVDAAAVRGKDNDTLLSSLIPSYLAFLRSATND
jgi:hypothetical protein